MGKPNQVAERHAYGALASLFSVFRRSSSGIGESLAVNTCHRRK